MTDVSFQLDALTLAVASGAKVQLQRVPPGVTARLLAYAISDAS